MKRPQLLILKFADLVSVLFSVKLSVGQRTTRTVAIFRRRPESAHLHSSPFRRSATVVGYRCLVADGIDSDASPSDRTDRGLAPIPRTFNHHVNRAHSMGDRGSGRRFSSTLRGEGCLLSRTTKAHRARAALGYHVTVRVSECDESIVERRDYVRFALRDKLPLSASSTSSRHSLF